MLLCWEHPLDSTCKGAIKVAAEVQFYPPKVRKQIMAKVEEQLIKGVWEMYDKKQK